jgi:hypothetical protein
MSTTADRTAAGRTLIKHELEALRWHWGEAYEICWDDARGWWARRLDGLGGELTADCPDELYAEITADYRCRPVARGSAPDSSR